MADDRNAAAARPDNGKSPRKVSKKATSKRRVLNVNKDLSASTIASFKKENSPSKPATSIRERTVIGQEASPKRVTSEETREVSQETFKSAVEFSENVRSEAEGCEDVSVPDIEAEELSKLRCTSERTEVIAEREKRKRQRCADYPGLAFGSSIFSSDTLMKFSVIRNELHNILNSQLKRAESEVAALNRRIQLLEEDLGKSEERLVTATAELAEASQAADESERIRKALENRSNMEDDRVAILETQFAQAKLIAEEADKKYEERKILENRSLADEERMGALENQLKEARFLAEEADKKYDEVIDRFLRSLFAYQ